MKPKQTAGPPDPPVEISKGGLDKRKSCGKEFDKLLLAEAEIGMRRRGSNTLDEADLENAYRHLLASLAKDWFREILSDILMLVGGALLAAGTAMAIESKFGQWPVWFIISGVIVSVAGPLIRHYPFKN